MNSCSSCGACCKVIGSFFKDSPGQREFLKARGIKFSVSGTNLLAYIPNICPNLVDNKCSIYDSRPFACRMFPEDIPNDLLLPGCGYKRLI